MQFSLKPLNKQQRQELLLKQTNKDLILSSIIYGVIIAPVNWIVNKTLFNTDVSAVHLVVTSLIFTGGFLFFNFYERSKLK